MAHLKQHRKVTLLRITQQIEEWGGGHLMPLMSKLGARVGSGLRKGIWKAFLFLAWKERMMKSRSVRPSVRPSFLRREKISSDVKRNILCELDAFASEGRRTSTNHPSSSRAGLRQSLQHLPGKTSTPPPRTHTPSPLCIWTGRVHINRRRGWKRFLALF